MKTCTHCILPETYPGITFDDQGVCNFCQAYQPQQSVLGKAQLIKVIKQKQQRQGKYDCVVPNSGGKDSSFILYYIVKELGLNPIVVSYNSGFQDEIAEENVINACELLGVDLEIIRSPGDIQRKILNSSYILSEKIGRPWGCANCPAILRMVSIQTAQKYNVPFIIWGSSKVESVKSANSEHSLGNAIKKGLKDPSIEYHGIRYIFFRIFQRIALKFPLKLALKPFKIPPFSDENPQFIHFFDYIQWDSMKNTALLEYELGWKHPPGKESRFDCTLHNVSNHHFLKTYGISHDGVSLCNMIREGKISRQEALEHERKIAITIDDEYKAIIEQIT